MKQRQVQFPFARAYDFILRDPKLTAAEKLVLIEVCRYWPKPYWGSAEDVSKACGLHERYARKLVRGLTQGAKKRKELGLPARKVYIKRGYAHTKRNGKPDTVRVIKVVCFPREASGTIGLPGGTRGPQGGNYRAGSEEPEGRNSGTIGPPNRIVTTSKNNNKGTSATASAQEPTPPLENQKCFRCDGPAKKYSKADGLFWCSTECEIKAVCERRLKPARRKEGSQAGAKKNQNKAALNT